MESHKSYYATLISRVKYHSFPFAVFLIIGLLFVVFIQQQNGRQLFGHDISLAVSFSETLSKEVLAKGQFPYWNPYSYCGMPLMSALNVIIFYPVSLLMLLLQLPMSAYFLYGVASAIVFAGFFMYLFVCSLGLSRLTATISGVFFAACGSLVSYINPGHDLMMYSNAMIPIVFCFITKGSKEDKLLYYILAGLMLGIQTMSTMFQLTFYIIICITIYFTYLFITEKKGVIHLLFFSVTGLVTVMISAVQLVQSYYYIGNSFRAGVDYAFFTSWSFHPLETITFLYPKFFGMLEASYWGRSPFWLTSDYIGILPVFLAVAGVFLAFKEKHVRFFSVFAVFLIIMSFGGYTPLYKLLYKMPVVNGFRAPGRWLGFFSFSVITLSAFGFEFLKDYFEAKTKVPNLIRKISIACLAVGGFFLLVYIVFALGETRFISWLMGLKQITKRFPAENIGFITSILYQMIRDDMLLLVVYFSFCFGLIYLVLKGKLGKIFFFLGCLFIVFIDNGNRFLMPRTFESGGGQFTLQVIKTEPSGQEDPRRTEIRNALSSDKSLFRVLPLGDLFNKNWFVEDKIQSCGGYHSAPLKIFNLMQSNGCLNDLRFIGLLNVKYLLSEAPIDHPALKLVNDGKVKIYLNGTALPRAFLVSTIEKASQEEVFLKMKNQNFDPRTKLFLNEEVASPIDNIKYIGSEVRIWSYEENSIQMQTDSPGNAMLFISETYYPEWSAYVDGVETKIYLADGFFRAIYLPKGKHSVSMRWNPKIFYVGLVITLAGIFVVLIFVAGEIFHNIRKRNAK